MSLRAPAGLRPLAAVALALSLAGCALAPSAPPLQPQTGPTGAAPRPVVCPEGIAASVRCLGGQDAQGAHYLIALPAGWNGGKLVVHAHGGPAMEDSRPARVAEDLRRWQVSLAAGYAWAGISFTKAGFGVSAAAEDVERLRRLFVQHVGQPTLTVLHGQSWGASVALKAAERYGPLRSYDAVLVTSGIVGPSSQAYDVRFDLRVVYQHLCRNHPRPDEPAYPLWMGLPDDSKMTQADLAARTRECLGLGLPAAQRTPEQARRLRTLLEAVKVPESSVQAHLNFATFQFRHLRQHTTGGRNLFSNIGARYEVSEAPDAFNQAVVRQANDPQARAEFIRQADFNGRTGLPMLSLHGIGDPTVFVEQQAELRETKRRAGQERLLVQAFTRHQEHSYLTDATYLTAFAALEAWVQSKTPPAAADFQARCLALTPAARQSECAFAPDYQVRPMAARVPARQRQ